MGRRKRGRTKKRRSKKKHTVRKHRGGSGKIKIFNWWSGTKVDEMPEYRYFELLLANCIDRFDEVHVYSIFPIVESSAQIATSHTILTIQYSGEPGYGDPNIFDINCIPGEHPTTNNFLILPAMSLHMNYYNFNTSEFIIPRKYVTTQSKFFLFSVSNGNAQDRIKFFK